MKIEPGTSFLSTRETAKPAAKHAFIAPQATSSSIPAETIETGGKKSAPPGLERALARLQSTPEADRNTGHTNAIEKLSRNLARYTETEALVEPPQTTTPATDSAPSSEPLVACPLCPAARNEAFIAAHSRRYARAAHACALIGGRTGSNRADN